MKSMLRVRTSLIVGGLMLAAGACWALQSGSKLFVEGQLASSDIRVINGQSYVPLRDVATAMHYHIVSQQGGINLTREGGANQVEGLHGTVGDPKEIFTGQWRFWARSITQMDTYTDKYNSSHDKVTPRKGETLYVVDCRIKNATKDSQAMILTVHSDGGTPLTDDMEHAYEVYDFDANNQNGAYGGPTLLPGSAGEFALIFSAPAGINLKDVIYTIKASPFNTNHGIDLRIAIPKQ